MLVSHSVMSNCLQPHGMQHTRLPCSSLSPGACSNSCPLSRWCHPTILSSVDPFSSCLQSFPPSESFPVNQVFTSGCQTTGTSASALVLPMNIQGWFPLELTGLISLQSKELSGLFSLLFCTQCTHQQNTCIFYRAVLWKSKIFGEALVRVFAAAATAKSLQSCPTLCDSIDGSPPESPIQARTLEWVAISFCNVWK